MKRIKLFLLCLALSFGLIAGSAQAAILNVALTPGLNSLNDRDVARLIDVGAQNGLVDVGDMVETLLIVDNISNSTFGGTPLGVAVGDATYQLTAHIVATITSKVATATPGIFDFTASMVANVYEDNSALANTILVDFAMQNAATALTRATDGNLILTVNTSGSGFGGTPDLFRIIGSDDLSLLTTGNEANYIIASTVVANPMAIPIVPDATLSGPVGVPPGTGDLHDVVAVGEEEVASTAVQAQGWDTQSDTTISFTIRGAVIPEMASLAVWGVLIGVGGLFAFKHRRNS